MRVVLTYGTFDLLHIGHLRLLERARSYGDRLVVGVSTDAFNATKGKDSVIPFAERSALVGALRVVDEVVAEDSWEQKRADIERLNISTLVMGNDWAGHFDDLSSACEVVYLPRTPLVSTTTLREQIKTLVSPTSPHIFD